jgi:hypothetical protein
VVRDFSPLHRVQTSTRACPTSNPMDTGGMKLTTQLYLVPRSRVVEIHFHRTQVFMAWRLISEVWVTLLYFNFIFIYGNGDENHLSWGRIFCI